MHAHETANQERKSSWKTLPASLNFWPTRRSKPFITSELPRSRFDDFPNALSEQIQLEWLSDDMHAVTQPLLADYRVFRIAGNEQHFELRSPNTSGVRDLPAIQAARQPYVGDQQIYADIRLQNFQPGWSVRSLHHRIAKF